MFEIKTKNKQRVWSIILSLYGLENHVNFPRLTVLPAEK